VVRGAQKGSRVKFYWSYTRFPELAEYARGDKMIVWTLFSAWEGGKEAKLWDRFIPVIIVASGLVGAVVGAFCSTDPHRGTSWGFGIGLVLSFPFIYFSYAIWLNMRRKVLKRYMQTDEYRNMRGKILEAQRLEPFIGTGFKGTEQPPTDLELDLRLSGFTGPSLPVQRL
jgi:hypothetical protein